MSCQLFLSDFPHLTSLSSDQSTQTMEEHLFDGLQRKNFTDAMSGIAKELQNVGYTEQGQIGRRYSSPDPVKGEPASPFSGHMGLTWRLPEGQGFFSGLPSNWAASPVLTASTSVLPDEASKPDLTPTDLMRNAWSPALDSQTALQSRSTSLPEMGTPRSPTQGLDSDGGQGLNQRSTSLPQSGIKDKHLLEAMRQKRRKCNRESARRVKARREKMMLDLRDANAKLANDKRVLAEEYEKLAKENLKQQQNFANIISKFRMEILRARRMESAAHPVTPPSNASRQNFRSLSCNAIQTPSPCPYTPPHQPISSSIAHCTSFDSLHVSNSGLGNLFDGPIDRLVLSEAEEGSEVNALLNLNWL
eukprot:jgi/Botrbrau1/6892/Bobra.67_3s0011.1